jgi:UDPglucose 6-dehydrogenase
LIKLASNSALANRVSLANEIASVAAAMDADVEDVLEGVRLDPRIGRDYLSPGIGFGGSCLPKDLSAFRSAASESAIPTPVLDGTARENELTVQRLIERAQHFRDSSGRSRVCVVGVAFKTGSDSVRDSRALVLVRSLLQEGFSVSVFDPKAERMARTYLPEAVTFAGSTQEAADNCDLAFVLDDSLVNGTRAFRQREIKLVDPLGRDWKSE